jgi:cytochrome c oxidase subunit 2
MNGPKLAGQADWYLKRQIMSYKNGLRGAHEDDAIGRVMIGMVATLADEAAVDNVVAHIQTLPDNPAAPTIDGDLAHGKKLYVVCAYCHGADGLGRQALNAPRIAGSSDWYLARQLQYFKDGVRGAHQQDFYGFQMGLMGQSLHDDQSVNDIIAYINTL